MWFPHKLFHHEEDFAWPWNDLALSSRNFLSTFVFFVKNVIFLSNNDNCHDSHSKFTDYVKNLMTILTYYL